MNVQVNCFSKFKFNDSLFKLNFSSYNINTAKYFLNRFSKINFKIEIMPLKYSSIRYIEKINIFEQLDPKEPKHSLIISSILDPKGKHGYGNLFLKLFFKIFPLEPMNISDDDIWEVTAEKERFDIRIRNINNTKIIIIENKSNWAIDQDNQLYRYWYNGIYLMQRQYEQVNIPVFSKILYLSPSDYKQPTIQSISRPNDWDKNLPEKLPVDIIKIVYFKEHMVDWLNLCISSVNKKDDISFYLSQYKEFWR